jgi:predicted methyltransferase
MRTLTLSAVVTTLVLCIAQTHAQNAGSAYQLPAGTAANIRRAVQSSVRTDEQRARDAGRKPAHVLTLAGIESGDRVVEFASFGHYYTTMLVEAVGPSGHVYMVDMPWIERFGGEPARAFDAAHDNATFMQVHYNRMDLPNNIDAAMMVLFYHDLKRDSAEESVDTADMNARIFRALRPGGTFLVVDHKAQDGSGWRDASTLHRIDAQTIVDEVTAAGFELVENSSLLANTGDDRTLNMRDPSLRGNTDRALLVFRKPEP